MKTEPDRAAMRAALQVNTRHRLADTAIAMIRDELETLIEESPGDLVTAERVCNAALDRYKAGLPAASSAARLLELYAAATAATLNQLVALHIAKGESV